jgi:glycosyltransferase involved in cell wall biosynthesis
MTESPRSKRKVLVLAPSLKGIGGVQNYTKTFVDALRDVLGNDRVRVVAVPEEASVQHDGPPALRTSAKIRFLMSAVASVISWRPDLVICAHIGVAPVGRLIRSFTGIPYWLVLYGVEVWGDLTPAKLSALQDAQRLVTITRFTLDATIKRHALREIPALILPPTLPRQRSSPPETSSGNSAVSRRPMVLTVGRIAASERYKGHDVMLEAWPSVLQRVPDAEYWIVGDGDDRERLESRARDMGIAGSLRFAGSVSPEELAVCYDRCSVFAMPARTDLDPHAPRGEGFGIVFLEAMAHGKPVVGPRVGAPGEFIRSGEHGLLVDPADPREVADALVELLNDPARARRMGDAAKEWVALEFSFERFCERVRQAML